MTDMTIPDGKPPRKLTVKDKMDLRDKEVAESKMRGVVQTYTPPEFPWAQYTRGAGSAFSATGWQRVGGFSLASGGCTGCAFSSASQQWTLSAGTWVVKAGLRYGNGTTSGGILMLGDGQNINTLNVYRGAETQVTNIANLAAMSLCTDIPVSSSANINMWGYVTSATAGNILDGVISFYQIG